MAILFSAEDVHIYAVLRSIDPVVGLAITGIYQELFSLVDRPANWMVKVLVMSKWIPLTCGGPVFAIQ